MRGGATDDGDEGGEGGDGEAQNYAAVAYPSVHCMAGVTISAKMESMIFVILIAITQ